MTAILLILTYSFVNAQPPIWKEFNSTQGGFSVLMPKTPASDTIAINTASGLEKSFVFTTKDEKLNDYLAAYSDSPDLKTEKTSTDKIFN